MSLFNELQSKMTNALINNGTLGRLPGGGIRDIKGIGLSQTPDRDYLAKILGTSTKSLQDYAGGESNVGNFVTDKASRNTYFRDLAKNYHDKDKTGDPVALVLNQLYGRGDMDGVDRMGDIIAEQLRPQHERGQAMKSLKDLLSNNASGGSTRVGSQIADNSLLVGNAGTAQNKRKGVSGLTSIRAGETGTVSGRKAQSIVGKGLLGSVNEVLGI